MIDTNQLKKGVCIVFKGAPMIVQTATSSTPTARGGNTITKTKLKNLLTGQVLNESFRSGEKFEEADLEHHDCAFMYADGTEWHFIDNQTFEQFSLSKDDIGSDVGYMKDGLEGLQAMVIDGQVVSVKLPLSVDLEVTTCDPAIKGATAKAQLKNAVTETGLEVLVPPYLAAGEMIRVDTRDGHFIERVK
ncbi:MAG TPA: elongation factor P [Planctomycetes bacterium]|nr:elongation factor P [Planctomycetota bacterium]HIL51467.1 elongation factor P [Planctomycetota bacterium]